MALSFCALATTGCSTTAGNGLPSLPFHAVVIPPEIHPTSPGAPGSDSLFAINFTHEALGFALQSGLENAGFARVTYLAGESTAVDDEKRLEAYQERARAVGADLLIVPTLTFSAAVEHGLDTTPFLLNLPLFLIGGPLNWFIPDRTYGFAEGEVARLDVRVYAVPQGDGAISYATLRDLSIIDEPLRVEVDKINLSFWDRAGHSYLSYVFSIFLPSSFLASETELARTEMQNEILGKLTRDLARQARSNRQLQSNPRHGGFQVNLDAVEVTNAEGNLVRLTVPVEAQPGYKLIKYNVNGGDDHAVDTDGRRCVIAASVPSGSEVVRVSIMDDVQQWRHYTFRVASQENQ